MEDEKLARQKLALYVNEHPDLDLLASFVSGEDFLTQNKETHYDLLLLDIGLPNMDGITLAAALPINCRVIFTTAFAEYAVEAFNLNATDYLLKPFDFHRFSAAIDKIKNTTEDSNQSKPVDNTILIKEGRKIHHINVNDIFYIKGLKEYVIWHTVKGQLITLHSLSHLSEYLNSFNFIQTHKSYIINAKKVSAMEYGFIHLNQMQIPIGRSYRQQVKKKFRAQF